MKTSDLLVGYSKAISCIHRFSVNSFFRPKFCRISFLFSIFILLNSISVGFAATDDIDVALPDDLDVLLGSSTPSKNIFSGYIKNETAYRYDEPRSFTKIRNVLYLNWQYIFSDKVKFYSSGFGYYDHVYDIFNYDTIVARNVRDEKEPLVFLEQLDKERDDKRAELKELYFDFFLNNLDIRIGKQYVVWGVLEGIRIVDEINPMDFRELIIPELLDYRIPLWTLKVNYYSKKTAYEVIWIPELKFHQTAEPGSEWELFQVIPTTTLPENYNPKFSEVGFKVIRDMFDAEVSFSYFFTWDDYPTTFRVISTDDVTSTDPTQDLPIFPTYTRMHMFGSTLTKEISGDILKAEFVYVKDKYFAIVDEYDEFGFLIDDGDIKRDHIRWGVGYDFSFWGADFSPAIAQWFILDYGTHILSDEFDTTFNLFIRKPLLKHSAVFTMLFIRLINFEETYIKPRMTFNLTDHFQVIAGGDFFIGRRTAFGREADSAAEGGLVTPEQRAQFLGNFNENNRISLEFKYNF